jgi:myosin heavy subunit
MHNLSLRYNQKAIYTRAGVVLIAINPYETIEDLYSKEFMTSMRHCIFSICFP